MLDRDVVGEGVVVRHLDPTRQFARGGEIGAAEGRETLGVSHHVRVEQGEIGGDHGIALIGCTEQGLSDGHENMALAIAWARTRAFWRNSGWARKNALSRRTASDLPLVVTEPSKLNTCSLMERILVRSKQPPIPGHFCPRPDNSYGP